MQVIDISDTIQSKSNQLNADDLMSGSITVTFSGVEKVSGEQPVILSYEGDNGKPWKPCKSMLRVLHAAWGKYANQWVGKSATLFRDAKVRFGAQDVGGIRISHLSHIDKVLTLSLTVTRNSKKPFTVQPLQAQQQPAPQQQAGDAARAAKAKAAADSMLQEIANIVTIEQAESFVQKSNPILERLYASYPDLYDQVMEALTAKKNIISTGGTDAQAPIDTEF